MANYGEFYLNEQLTSSDLGTSFSLLSQSMTDLVSNALYPSTFVLVNGMQPIQSATADNGVQIKSGLAYQNGQQILLSSEQGVNILPGTYANGTGLAADSTNPRIDVVYIQYTQLQTNSQTRTFFPPNQSSYSEAVFTQYQDGYTLSVVHGTPATTPTVPAIPTGTVALAHVLVPASATTITTTDITDETPTLRTDGGRLALATGGILSFSNVTSINSLPGFKLAFGNTSYIYDNTATSRLDIFGGTSGINFGTATAFTKSGTPIFLQPTTDATSGTHVISLKNASGTEYGYIDNNGNISINTVLFPNLMSFPPIGPTGSMIVVMSMPYVSNGTAWVDPMTGLMALSTTQGGTADFYGPTVIHGGVGLTVKELPSPTGLSAANATSGAVGAYIVANTAYTYELTAVSYSGTETNASASVSITTGATAYPINLTWTNGGADVQFYNVYKGGDFLAQVAGTATSYVDDGNTATTSQVPPSTNQTGIITGKGNGLTNLPVATTSVAGAVELRTAATGSVPVVLSEPDLGVANGVATLNANTLVPQSQLTPNTLSHAGALTALYNFNGTTSSTRGQRGQFSRASAANNPQTLASLPNDAPSYVWSKWGAEALALSVWEGTTNLVYNSDFETVTTTATLFSDPLTTNAAWTVQSGGFTYSASGATSGAANSIITAGNSAWKPLLGSDGSTSLPLTAQATITTPSTFTSTSQTDFLLQDSNGNQYLIQSGWGGSSNTLTLGKKIGTTYTLLAQVANTWSASTTYTMTLSLDHIGNITAKLYSGAGTGGTLLQTLTANDTSLSGGFLLGVGGDTGVVVSNASMTGAFANVWTTNADGSASGFQQGAFALSTSSKNGTYAVSIVNNNGAVSPYPESAHFNVSASTAYVISFYANVISLGTNDYLKSRVIEWNGSTVEADDDLTVDSTPTNGWQRFTQTITTTASTSQISVRPQLVGVGNVLIDCIQVEAKSYITPYLQNNSTTATATRAAETMTVPATGLSASSGAMRANFQQERVASEGTVALFGLGQPVSENLTATIDTNGHLNVSYGDGGTGQTLVGATVLVENTFYDIAVVWSSSGVIAYINGTQEVSGTVSPKLVIPSTVSIAASSGGASQLDGSISNLALFNRALTAQEIYSIYASTQPLVDALATPISPAEQSLNSAVSSPDSNDNYTVATYRRRDNTIESVATLSGTPSPSGSSNYPTLTIQYYDRTGTVVTETVTYALTYDANDKITSKVIQ